MKQIAFHVRYLLVFLLFSLMPPLLAVEPVLDAKLLEPIAPRPLGPANMSGRICGVAVVEGKPATIYVASASGGLWKSSDDGVGWAPIMDSEASSSMGDVAVAPSNPDIVWVGTGEANLRNSVSWGDGVYKSTDAGKTWRNMGLKDSRHIGRIVIHPTDPDIVYVAALGHAWGASKERGLFKTTDGGKTWENVCFLGDETGFIDLAMDPTNSDVLYGCAYHVRRDEFDGGNPVVQTSTDAGIYKTEDAGKKWNRLANGLPDRPIGRCGISICRKSPHILFAVVQTDQTKLMRANEHGQEARTSDKAETGGIFRSEDRGKTWTKVNDLCPRPFYFSQIRVDPSDDKRLWVLGVTLHLSIDGGKTFRSQTWANVHADHHAMWIDPNDPTHMVLGNDGGLNISRDQGKSWEFIKNLPLAQFYSAAPDGRSPYRVYGGLQDNGSWGGVSATRFKDGITAADWFRIAAADGFYCAVDPSDSDTVYCESQYGAFIKRLNVRAGTDKEIQPLVAKGRQAYRFNWCTPILVSTHNPKTIYVGGNHLFRSQNRGDLWEECSLDLTLGKPGPSADMGHTITTIAESPVKARILWVGTDDGRIHVTRVGGDTWTDVSDKLPGVPAERFISRIECSHFDENTAYLALTRYRNDDTRAYLFKTTDLGATWISLVNDLPAQGPIHVVREDSENRDLLFVGTEFGLFVSGNGGASWLPIRSGFPTVPVRDLAIQPHDRELVIGTHGRGVWVLNIKPLEELTPAVLAEPIHLFDTLPATVFQYKPARSTTGSKAYIAPNPPFGATIWYSLKDHSAEAPRMIVIDAAGKPIVTLEGSAEAGLHRIVWDLRAGKSDDGKPAPLVKPGDYGLRLEVGDKMVKKKLRVEADK